MMNTKTYEFEAIIKKVPYIDFPYDVKDEFSKARVKVYATFDGFPYEGSLVRRNTPNHIIDIRKQINKQAGQLVKVTIRERE